MSFLSDFSKTTLVFTMSTEHFLGNSTQTSNETSIDSYLEFSLSWSAQFWLILISEIPSLNWSFFILGHLFLNKTLQKALNNHVIIVLSSLVFSLSYSTIPSIWIIFEWAMFGLDYHLVVFSGGLQQQLYQTSLIFSWHGHLSNDTFWYFTMVGYQATESDCLYTISHLGWFLSMVLFIILSFFSSINVTICMPMIMIGVCFLAFITINNWQRLTRSWIRLFQHRLLLLRMFSYWFEW